MKLGIRIACFIALMSTLMLTGGCGSARTELEAMKADITALQETLSSVQAENAALTEDIGQLRQEVETYGGMVMSIPEAQAAPAETRAAEEAEFMQALGTGDGQDAAISAENEIAPDEPDSEQAEAGAEKDAVTGQASALTSGTEPEAADIAASPSKSAGQGAAVSAAPPSGTGYAAQDGTADKPQPSAPTASGDSEQQTVYITATGSKYHYNSNCNGGTYYESTLAEALAKGLTPCKKCAGG